MTDCPYPNALPIAIALSPVCNFEESPNVITAIFFKVEDFMFFVSSSTTKTFCSARSGMVFCKEKYAKILDKGTFPGSLGSLMFNTMAAKTWSFKYAASQEFHDIMAQVIVNAKCLAEELQKYGFRIVSGGTDNHLLVVDLRSKGLTGKTMQNALDAVGITVNKNMIPFDPEKPSWIF